MSADLLAEFGQCSGTDQTSAHPPQSARPQPNTLGGGLDQSDDIFFGTTSDSLHNLSQNSTLASLPSQYAPVTPRQAPSLQAFDLPRQEDSDVLFDATLDTPASDADDDWGEFEGPEATAQPSPGPPQPTAVISKAAQAPSSPRAHDEPRFAGTAALLGSLSLVDPITHPNQPFPVGPNKPQASNPLSQSGWDDDSFGDWVQFADAQSTKPSSDHLPKDNQLPAPSSKPLPADENDSFGEWGGFTDGPSANPTTTTRAKVPLRHNPPQPTWEDGFDTWDDFTDGPALTRPAPISPSPQSFTSSALPSSTAVRPTNIPPPSILLDLLLTRLQTLAQEAQAAKTQPAPSKAAAAVTIITTLTAAAHIIAGRSHRWKRDTLLAKSMRIGPAGKAGGMKLSAVNKHEDVKEAQDAVDVLGAWRERAALFAAVVQSAGRKPVPVVLEPGQLKVVTARAEAGALKAGHACALCALKRDERVLRLDEEVQDSFGEWWTEHWGHTGCRVFWEENKESLGQR
ncbi:hypothetical protein N7462_009146 [Penicillium macrosclerotiorum]|uniref:uncharacterized protein n=1 Tax=Penicillium macrosclerotiorum TaxID=303699 RepID=UPI0025470EEE|nr:uncharacterized protein N7462_009146 [Penicillium macrosclerotiorum]KAJ5676249.1 hypothetical protein N7462_009146 [Penicillium macrosclerotiorum]